MPILIIWPCMTKSISIKSLIDCSENEWLTIPLVSFASHFNGPSMYLNLFFLCFIYCLWDHLWQNDLPISDRQSINWNYSVTQIMLCASEMYHGHKRLKIYFPWVIYPVNMCQICLIRWNRKSVSPNRKLDRVSDNHK